MATTYSVSVESGTREATTLGHRPRQKGLRVLRLSNFEGPGLAAGRGPALRPAD